MQLPLWLAVSVLACAVLQFALVGFLLKRVRLRHASVWESLERPSLLGGTKKHRATNRFIWSGRPSELNDPVLANVTFLIRINTAALVLLFAAQFFV